MLNYLGAIHRISARMWLQDTCRIERITTAGAWTLMKDGVRCQVQAPRASVSSSDPNVATIEEKAAISVYMGITEPVQAGDRLIWRGEVWDVNSVVGERTAGYALTVECSQSQTALYPEVITFRRRRDGAWVELGQFTMRFTTVSPGIGQPGPAATAEGATILSTMIGGVGSDVLQVGDWFGRNGLPGQIVEKDATEPDHVEFLYQMEVKVP